jgi:hypothetical protein
VQEWKESDRVEWRAVRTESTKTGGDEKIHCVPKCDVVCRLAFESTIKSIMFLGGVFWCRDYARSLECSCAFIMTA